MQNIQTTIQIAAHLSTVWGELTAFSKFSEWNPLITQASGDIGVGKQQRIIITDK